MKASTKKFNDETVHIFVARLFVTLLKGYLTAEQFAEILRKNGTQEYIGCCASHDYCDANMVMLEAYANVMKISQDDVDISDDKVLDVFNRAWDYAGLTYLGKTAA